MNNLISVTVDSNSPIAITESVFSNRANATLYVPYGCKAAYETADYWKEFKEIVEAAPSVLLYAEEAFPRCGSQVVIPVLFKNKETYGGLQCEVTLPAGIMLS